MLSLVQIHEADAYLLYSLKKRVWDIFIDKEAALVSATRIIMNLPLKVETLTILEEHLSEVEDVVIDSKIKEACIEIALSLADGIDPEMEYRQLAKTTQGYGPLRQTKNTEMVEQYLAMGIPCLNAWVRLLPFLKVDRLVVLERTS